MDAYIARQAIFDRDKHVVGYELLYRDGSSPDRAVIVDGSAATREVLSGAVTLFGLTNLTNRLPAYVNFTRDLLLEDFALLADPGGVYIELSDTLPMDDALAAHLLRLKGAGYTLVLDHFSAGSAFEPLLPLFSVVKLDFSDPDQAERRALVEQLRGGPELLAVRVETEAQLQEARDLGFTLFQGYLFARPVCMRRQIVPISASAHGQLLEALRRAEPDYGACCEIVQWDVALTWLLLRQIQTDSYYRGERISGPRGGLPMLGADELRRWLTLVLAQQGGVPHSDLLPRRAYVRGLFIERMMRCSDCAPDPYLGFLLGMFSLLDRIAGTQIHELLGDLDLDPALKRALMGIEENIYTGYLEYAIVYEMGIARIDLPDPGLRIDERGVSELYLRCVIDVDDAFQEVEACQG